MRTFTFAIIALSLTACAAFQPRQPDGTTFKTIGGNPCPPNHGRTLRAGECEYIGYDSNAHTSILIEEEEDRQN
jgi:hypothetical protein